MRSALLVATAALAALLPAGSLAPTARAQGPDSIPVRARDDTEAQRLFGSLMSPYCTGLTIATCPSPGADSLRRDIRSRLDSGESPREIRAWYVAAWGERVLGAPPVRDWGIVLWIVPGVLLAAGAAALSLWLRTQQRRAGAAEAAVRVAEAPGETPVELDLRARLEAELRRFEEFS